FSRMTQRTSFPRDWSSVVCSSALIDAGGRRAGIYTTNSAAQCRYITEHCDAEVAFVEDHHQLAKFLSFRAELPKLRAIVLMKGEIGSARCRESQRAQCGSQSRV